MKPAPGESTGWRRRERTQVMSKRYGFTLVELLVVVAIIAILASIVVPNVTRYIARGQMARAVSEINSIELAMTAMLADAERSSFRDFFTDADINLLVNLNMSQTAEIYDLYSDIMYALLRAGRNARNEPLGIQFNDNVLDKLSTNYLDLDFDPWGRRYYFYLGRARLGRDAPMPFRGYFLQEDTTGDGIITDNELKTWAARRLELEAQGQLLPGSPPPDGLPGRPAPDSQPFFIWSMGANLQHDQEFNLPRGDPDGFYRGGGDDINNWDPGTGWRVHYGG
jgi:prepilin-type N-terminal cleavage/methylation domain-containing protein